MGQEQPRALAAQLTLAVGGQDHVVDQGGHVGDLDVVLGHLEKVELLGEEAPRQRDPQAAQHGLRQAGPVGHHVLVAADGLGDLVERGAGAGQDVDEEAGPVLHQPLLDELQDLLAAQVSGGQLEGTIAEQQVAVRVAPLAGHVALAGDGIGVRPGARLQQHAAGRFDAHAVEVVEHLAGDAQVELGIRGAQHLQRGFPCAASALATALFPAFAQAVDALVQDVVRQAIGDGGRAACARAR